MGFFTHPWHVVEQKWDPEKMRLGESLCSLGNGYMGLRGNFEEQYSGDTHRGTYLGGVWFPDKTRVGWWKNGYPQYIGKVINAVNLIGIDVAVDGELLDLHRFPVVKFLREVDMQRGILHRVALVEMDKGTVRIESQRFVSVAKKELLAIRYSVTPSYPAHIVLKPYLDGNVKNLDANYDEVFWEMLLQEQQGNVLGLLTKTKENPFGAPRFTVAAAMAVHAPDMTLARQETANGRCQAVYGAKAAAGEAVSLDKFSLVVTSRDHEEERLLPLVLDLADKALEEGYDAALQAHEAGWKRRWEMADVQIYGDDAAQQGIRFNLFHLLSTYSGEDERLNIGPKGFTGEKYGGATYWDTEAYCLPVYMAVAGDQVARQLLLYRHRQLPGAFSNARQQGLQGALYPMVTFTGIECHNEWEITFEEIHRNGAIAHGIFDYVTYTGDDGYLKNEGLDVLSGIALFWLSRVHFSKRAGKYMIHGVTGPNEYENNVSNNWYTNRIAAWCLDFALEAAKMAGPRRVKEAGLTEDDLSCMREVSQNMYYLEDAALGIFVQHDTFLDKDIRPASDIDPKERPINQHWSWDRILRSCYIKQADVLQGLYFLGHLYDKDVKKRNFDFYEPLTVHESSLSPCVHSILAAEIGYIDKAVEMYRRTARLDLDNINHDTEDGLHVTSMAGSWLSIAQGFAGMRTANGLSFAPFLPDCWQGYAFNVNYRGRLLRVAVDKKGTTLTLLEGESLSLSLYGKNITVEKEAYLPFPEAKNHAGL